MKKVSTAVVALALGMSEVTIKEMYENAKEIEFSEAFKLKENLKLKRYNTEAEKLADQLERFGKLMEE